MLTTTKHFAEHCDTLTCLVLQRDDYKLELLNIGHNQFKDEGMLAIEQDMATNKSLVRLGFQKCGLTNIGLEVASRIILQNKYLEVGCIYSA